MFSKMVHDPDASRCLASTQLFVPSLVRHFFMIGSMNLQLLLVAEAESFERAVIGRYSQCRRLF